MVLLKWQLKNIVVNIEENFLRCVFTNCIYDVEITLKEFENYVIDLNNQRGLI